MVIVAPFVRLEPKPGKEPEVEKFLECRAGTVEGEPATTAWFALRLGPSRFGIFDAFPNEVARACRGGAHLEGDGPAARQAASIEKLDVFGTKLPG